MLQTAAPRGPQHAGGVRVVHHKRQAVATADARQLRQARHIAVHAEHGIGDDKPLARTFPHNLRLQVRWVVVGVNYCARPRQAAAVNDAGVVEGVAEDMAFCAAQSADDAHIGRIAAVAQQGGLAALEAGQQVLQPHMGAHVARNEA